MKFTISSVLFFSWIFCCSAVEAGDSTYYFYHGLPYGSEKNFHPLTVIVNGGFGIMQIDNRSTKINSIDFRTGASNVWMNITHPFREVKKFGVNKFLTSEVIPTKLKASGAQWVPNYQLHLIGGGMTYRTMYEWYRYHKYQNPRVQALVSLAVYNFLNEIVENNSYEGTNVDPIADMLIFDPLSVLLFSFDPVARFFGRTLHMADSRCTHARASHRTRHGARTGGNHPRAAEMDCVDGVKSPTRCRVRSRVGRGHGLRRPWSGPNPPLWRLPGLPGRRSHYD